jgi:CubicO group peptidase (beta-lactamase class C family)
MHERFREVTLIQLVCHRAGVDDSAMMAHMMEWRTSQAPVLEQREELCRLALAAAPKHEPGSTFEYANTGFVIAGHVAEVATGKPWEELMRTLLFSPLGMKSAGFGAPGVANADDQPRGHFPGGAAVEPGPMADNPAVIGPAGTVHATLGDWAKYVQMHLAGVREDVKLGEITLTVDDFAVLHEAFDGPGQGYGFGWVHDTRPWAGRDGAVLWHNGSNTMWYALTWLGLENGVAGLAVTNVFTPAAQGATDEVVGLLVKEWERRGAPAGELAPK